MLYSYSYTKIGRDDPVVLLILFNKDDTTAMLK